MGNQHQSARRPVPLLNEPWKWKRSWRKSFNTQKISSQGRKDADLLLARKKVSNFTNMYRYNLFVKTVTLQTFLATRLKLAWNCLKLNITVSFFFFVLLCSWIRMLNVFNFFIRRVALSNPASSFSLAVGHDESKSFQVWSGRKKRIWRGKRKQEAK